MYRRRRTQPTAKEIADALEKVREERMKNLSTPKGAPSGSAPPFYLPEWIEQADLAVLDTPGCALMIVSWVLDVGYGAQVTEALVRKFQMPKERVWKRLRDQCYSCGWLMEALLGGPARRHQDAGRVRSFMSGGRTDPRASGDLPS